MQTPLDEQRFTAADDRFHLPGGPDTALTETVWFNFYVPEYNIDAEIYLCFRRNLGVTYAGLYIWDAYCRHFTDARYFDTRSYLPLPHSDLHDFELDNGLSIRTLESLHRYRVAYRGSRELDLQLEFEALAPPVGFVTRPDDPARAAFAPGHFDQVGRMRGVMRLDGVAVPVDCITQRDRSWGATRKEDLGYPPDVDWHSAHFGDDLWIQCWLWHEEPVASDLQSGIVYRHGRPIRLISAQRRTEYDPSGTEARAIELRLQDTEGNQYYLRGKVRNMFPWPGWFNMVGFAGLVEWQLDNRSGWGEVHDGRTVDGIIARKRRR